jgi:hypothetical protein
LFRSAPVWTSSFLASLGTILFERTNRQSLTLRASKMHPLDGHVSHDRAGGALMKRVQYLHHGAPEELRLDEVTPPDAGRAKFAFRSGLQQPTRWTGKFAGAR